MSETAPSLPDLRLVREDVEAIEADRRRRELASLEAFAYRSGDVRLKNAVAFARLSFPALREAGKS